jgi:hypothetical protein
MAGDAACGPFAADTPCLGRPLPAVGGRKRLECPKCRKQCSVKGSRAAELPTNYDIMGA